MVAVGGKCVNSAKRRRPRPILLLYDFDGVSCEVAGWLFIFGTSLGANNHRGLEHTAIIFPMMVEQAELQIIVQFSLSPASHLHVFGLARGVAREAVRGACVELID